MDESAFKTLTDYLGKIPSIETPIATGLDAEGFWWVKFQIDIDHELAWRAVQELSCVVNYLSIEERLPAIFFRFLLLPT